VGVMLTAPLRFSRRRND